MKPTRPRVAVVRGRALNPFELQAYAPLRSEFDIIAIGRKPAAYEVEEIDADVVLLPERNNRARRAMHRVRRTPSSAEDDSLRGLEEALKTADIVHSADLHLGVSEQCARVAQQSGVPLVLTCWENIPFRYDDDARLRDRRRLVRSAASRFLAVTATARTCLIEEGASSDRVEIIPAAIDTTRFQVAKGDQEMRQRWGVPADALCIVYIGRMIQEKGVVELARAFASIGRINGRNVHLVCVGNGNQRLRLEEIVATHAGLSDRLHIEPGAPYREVRRVMAAADVVAVPSLPTPYWQEQFGMVLVEAMACGRAIITTRSGSIPDVVADAAVLVEPYDVDSLGDGLRAMLEDDDQRAHLARKARARAESQFSTEVVAAQIGAVYRSVLA